MVKCLSIGNCNRYFIYIFLSILFHILNDTLYGFNYNDSFVDVKFIDTKTQDYFSWHDLIHKIFSFLGTIPFAYYFNKYESFASQRESLNTVNNSNSNNDSNNNESENKNKDKQSLKMSLIHNEIDDNLYADKYSFTICLLIIFLWIIEELLIDTFGLALKDLDFWMFELIIITIFSIKMFKIEIYNHQIFAMWFCIIPCILKIATIVLSFFEKDDIKRIKLPIFYINYLEYIPIGIIIYILLITCRAFVNCEIKWFMDLKYISPSKLLFYYGIAGAIISTLICTISTFIKCDDIPNSTDIYDYICKIPYDGKEENNFNYSERYFDSFLFYINTFRGKINNNFKPIEIFYEIIISILGVITFFFYKYFSILVIQNLTPVYLIFSNPIYFFIQKSILLIYTYINEDGFFADDTIKFLIYKFCLDLLGDLMSIIGFLVYLEIIELKFGNYDYNLKVNIIKRGIVDSFGQNKSIINEEEEEKESENDENGNESEDLTFGGES